MKKKYVKRDILNNLLLINIVLYILNGIFTIHIQLSRMYAVYNTMLCIH